MRFHRISKGISLLLVVSSLLFMKEGMCEESCQFHEPCMIVGNQVYFSGDPLSLADVIKISLCHNQDIQPQRFHNSGCECNENLCQTLTFLSNKELNYSSSGSPSFSWVGSDDTQFSTFFAHRTGDLANTYNRLNLAVGVASLPKYHSSSQRCLRARQNLILDIVRCYYRAVVAKKGVDLLHGYIETLENNKLETLQEMERRQQTRPDIEGLRNEHRLVHLQSKYHAFRIVYEDALADLTVLTGVCPGFAIELAEVTVKPVDLGTFDICSLENSALCTRPEMVCLMQPFGYDSSEVRSMFSCIFPHAHFITDPYLNADTFHPHAHRGWLNASEEIFQDLLCLPGKCCMTRSSRLEGDARVALSMGVIAQVELALISLGEMHLQQKLSAGGANLKRYQLQVGKLMGVREQIKEHEVMDYQVISDLGEVDALRGYANLQVALFQLGNAIGRPFYFVDMKDELDLDWVENCVCHEEGIIVTYDELMAEDMFFEDYMLYCEECSEVTDLLEERRKRREALANKESEQEDIALVEEPRSVLGRTRQFWEEREEPAESQWQERRREGEYDDESYDIEPQVPPPGDVRQRDRYTPAHPEIPPEGFVD